MNLVISKCVTAVNVSNFSGHYPRNRSTLDIGVLGYIRIVQHKEHSPEVLSIPPGTPCISKVMCCCRTFPVLGCACNFPSAQQDCRSVFRVIYVGGPLKGPQLTTTTDALTPTRYCVLSLISFVS